MIKFFSKKSEYIKKKNIYLKRIDEVLKKGIYTNGQSVKLFEKLFAKFNKAKYCVATNTGTSALNLALKILEIKKNSEVLMPSISFIATPAAAIYARLVPAFVDVNCKDWLINVAEIEKRITSKTKCIMPVHLHGLMADMKKIHLIANKYNLKVIEDASQAHGSKYFGKNPGYYSDIACFSFYPTKTLGAYGEGGAIITNNYNIYKKALLYRDWCKTLDMKNFHDIGFNYRMPEITGALLLQDIKDLKNNIKKRIRIAEFYKKNLRIKNFVYYDVKNYVHSYYVFAVRVKNREKLRKILISEGIETNITYPYCLPYTNPFRIKKEVNSKLFNVGYLYSKEKW
jgi:dTDP-4-amino-4,6-dideoxygalactose transaminase